MNSYFSTFTTGFSNVVRIALKEFLPDIKIDLLLDGLISYRTNANSEDISKIPFLNNSFILLGAFKNLSQTPFEDMLEWTKQNKINLSDLVKSEDKVIKPVFVEKNQYVSVEKHLVDRFEQSLGYKVRFDRQQGQELWFLVRSERYGLMGLRFTGNDDDEVNLNRGQLRPELACLLCLISKPRGEDVFLDPFAGWGSIPHARLKFAYKKIIVSDNDLEKFEYLQENIKGSNIEVENWNGLHLSQIENDSINEIVTDPPWGIYDEKINVGNFYIQMLREFYRILKPDGLLVLLVSRNIDMERLLEAFENRLKQLQKIETLVNGQKATVYVFQKTTQ